MKNRILGYARVSTKEQREDRQMLALENNGVLPVDIFIDKISGKSLTVRWLQIPV